MKRSVERILTTHVGSLARPDALVPLLKARDRVQPYDLETYAKLVRDAVAAVVRRRTDAGGDNVTDGAQGRARRSSGARSSSAATAPRASRRPRPGTPIRGGRAASTGPSPTTTRGP